MMDDDEEEPPKLNPTVVIVTAAVAMTILDRTKWGRRLLRNLGEAAAVERQQRKQIRPN